MLSVLKSTSHYYRKKGVTDLIRDELGYGVYEQVYPGQEYCQIICYSVLLSLTITLKVANTW